MTVCNSSEGLRFEVHLVNTSCVSISASLGRFWSITSEKVDGNGRINVGKLHFCDDFMLSFLFFLSSQCCVEASVGFRHKKHWKTRFHIQKCLVNRCEICTDPRQISSRFTFRNVGTQTRARVAGLAASSPVTSDLITSWQNCAAEFIHSDTITGLFCIFCNNSEVSLRFTWNFDGNMMNVWQFNNWIIARYWSYLMIYTERKNQTENFFMPVSFHQKEILSWKSPSYTCFVLSVRYLGSLRNNLSVDERSWRLLGDV